MGGHGRQQGPAAAHVHIPVEQRLVHRLGHGLEAGEMDHGIDAAVRRPAARLGCERLLKGLRRSDVAFQQPQAAVGIAPRQIHHPTQGFGGAVGEVVEHHQFVARLKQHAGRVGADEASAAGDQDLRHREALTMGILEQRMASFSSFF